MTRSTDDLKALENISHEMAGLIAAELNTHEVVLGEVSHWYGCEVCTPDMRQGTPPKECNERCRPPK